MPTHRLIRCYCFNDRELTNTDLKQNWFYERRGRYPREPSRGKFAGRAHKIPGIRCKFERKEGSHGQSERKSAWQPGERHSYTLADSLHKPTLGRESHKD